MIELDMQNCISILYAASQEPIGILLKVSDREKCKARLYQAKYRTKDPSLEGLQIRFSPFDEEDRSQKLIIVNRILKLERPTSSDMEGL